jgi:hypothetical protein
VARAGAVPVRSHDAGRQRGSQAGSPRPDLLGQVPVRVTIGGTEFITALFPRDARYLVPLKAAVQRAEGIGEGALVEVAVRLRAAPRK